MKLVASFQGARRTKKYVPKPFHGRQAIRPEMPICCAAQPVALGTEGGTELFLCPQSTAVEGNGDQFAEFRECLGELNGNLGDDD